MSENLPHRRFKERVLQFLRADIAGQAAWKMADIGFSCNDHIHLWAIPDWAAWVESERQRKTASGLTYRPDIVILDAHDNPLAIIEVTDRNRTNNCRRAADELEIPWFRFWAPAPEATQAVLATRTYPQGHGMRDSNGFHAEVDGYDQDGATRFGTIHHSEVAPGSVNIGNILFANATNLTCRWTDWYDKRENLWKNAKLYRDGRGKLAKELGQKILDAMETLNRNPQPFTAGIGEWQLHGEIGVYHLNRDPESGRYPPVDIAGLIERHRVEHGAVLQTMEALDHPNEVDRPPFPGTNHNVIGGPAPAKGEDNGQSEPNNA